MYTKKKLWSRSVFLDDPYTLTTGHWSSSLNQHQHTRTSTRIGPTRGPPNSILFVWSTVRALNTFFLYTYACIQKIFGIGPYFFITHIQTNRHWLPASNQRIHKFKKRGYWRAPKSNPTHLSPALASKTLQLHITTKI